MNEDEKIPPFIQGYLDKMDHEGYADFVRLSREFQKEREEYPGKHALQSSYLANFNRATGKSKSLDYNEGLTRIDDKFKKQAYELAKQHGYKGLNPQQSHDKEFTKQGEKFIGMINQAKQDRQAPVEKAPQAGPEPGPETENIQKLKDQQSIYRYNPLKVEYHKTESDKPEKETEKNQEDLRSAFLQKLNKLKEQQIQPKKDVQIGD